MGCVANSGPRPLPRQRDMGCQQTARAGWSDLPDALAAHILQLAFDSSDRTPRQWLRMSLVCRWDLNMTRTIHCSKLLLLHGGAISQMTIHVLHCIDVR